MMVIVMSLVWLQLVVDGGIRLANVRVREGNVDTPFKVFIKVRKPVAFIPDLISPPSVAAVCTAMISHVVSGRGAA